MEIKAYTHTKKLSPGEVQPKTCHVSPQPIPLHVDDASARTGGLLMKDQ